MMLWCFFKPHIYIFARFPATTELTAYSETRMEDLNDLKEPILFQNVEVFDVIRFFKGDGPSCQFEAGQQKGGHYFCCLCGIHCSRVNDYAHASYNKILSLKDRQTKVLQTSGSISRSKRGDIKVYNNLDKDAVAQELHERNVKFLIKNNANILRDKLTKEMCGIQRVPSLLFNNPEEDISETVLRLYEILGCEPLHEHSNQIQNLYAELPHHHEDKATIIDFIEGTFNGKDCRRAADYRQSLIRVYLFLDHHYPHSPLTNILFTLCEMQRINYHNEADRTNENILRMYVQSFLHMILLKENIEKKLKCITQRKLFGKYYHALITHAPDQLRIIDGRSANTENEERKFNFLKVTSLTSSNRHADNIILNAFIRSTAREKLGATKDFVLKTESDIL